MKHVFTRALCAFALVTTCATIAGAKPLPPIATELVVVQPVLEGRMVYIRPPTPSDLACSLYSCRPGGRRNPNTNPEGDVFITGTP